MQEFIPWIEKYRPRSIDQLILDDMTRAQISTFLQDTTSTHLIITGVPGIGKTSTARILATHILGGSLDHGYLELNAAEDRGIKSLVSIVDPFCKRVFSKIPGSRIIFLDEADYMTKKYQYDISGLIKQYGQTTKFIFICNDLSKIVENLQSICHIILFRRLTSTQMMQYLSQICENENIPYTENGLNMIIFSSRGDMRKAINDLQKIACSFRKISRVTVIKTCKIPDLQDIFNIITLCQAKSLISALESINAMLESGFYYLDIIDGFAHVIKEFDIPDEALRLRILDVVYQSKITMSTGARTRLQFMALIARIIRIMNSI